MGGFVVCADRNTNVRTVCVECPVALFCVSQAPCVKTRFAFPRVFQIVPGRSVAMMGVVVAVETVWMA